MRKATLEIRNLHNDTIMEWHSSFFVPDINVGTQNNILWESNLIKAVAAFAAQRIAEVMAFTGTPIDEDPSDYLISNHLIGGFYEQVVELKLLWQPVGETEMINGIFIVLLELE